MNLYYQEFGTGKPIIILHGLFGASDNWLSIGKQLAESYHVYLLDQRNHGKSPHSHEWDYEAMSEDLKNFIEQHQIDQPIVLGHSMGGKTAMWFACKYPHLLSQLVVADMATRAYPPHHQTILEGLNAIDLPSLAGRKEADNTLSHYIKDLGTRAFLLKSLYRDNDQYAWRINLEIITQKIENIMLALPTNFRFEGNTLFIRGAKSDYVQDKDWQEIQLQFPNAQLKTIQNAGHWLHAEQPEAFLETLQSELI